MAGAVYDPQGDGNPDYKSYVDRAYDGNPGLRVADLGLQAAVPHPEDRCRPDAAPAPADDPPLGADHQRDTRDHRGKPIGDRTDRHARPDHRARLRNDHRQAVDHHQTNPPKSNYLLVFVTKMAKTGANQYQSKINEIAVTGN